MTRRLLVAVAIALALKSLVATGAASDIFQFRPWIDTSLVGGIVSNLLLIVVFAELYWYVDQEDDDGDDSGQAHFGFESAVDAYYYSTVTSSSVGFGDILPRTTKAKVLTMVHILSMFFVMLPVVLKALEK